MAGKGTISHDGEVVAVHGNHIQVKIITQSACADCHARSACIAADFEEKIIDAVNPNATTLQPGDPVTVTMEIKMAWLAVFYGFVLPLIVLVIFFFTTFAFTQNETLAALTALCSLVPYYFLLYRFRQLVERKFHFWVHKRDLHPGYKDCFE